MKERPILFSGPMVRAILSGQKTQTRRVVKPAYVNVNGYSLCEVIHGDEARKVTGPNDRAYVGFGHPSSRSLAYFGCPYGQPGDRLWVRETWNFYDWTEDGEPFIGYAADASALVRRAYDEEWADRLEAIWAALSTPENYVIHGRASDKVWRPSIHMPRFASRITLEIVSVRVERLNEISEADALEEGITYNDIPNNGLDPMRARTWFRGLWESINGTGSWDANPWVWVIEFKRAD